MESAFEDSKRLFSSVIAHINAFLKKNDVPEIHCDCSLTSASEEIRENTKRLADNLTHLLTSKENKETQKIDSAVVQITASKQQLDKRINAFMLHAQNAVDEQNLKEFCDDSGESSTPGCARTDSCYKPRASHSTHMQVKKASNTEGPQLQITSQGMWKPPARISAPQRQIPQTLPQPINERLVNLEAHLNPSLGSLRSSDIYTRLKNLEDRLLLIEGTSPEYLAKDSTKGSDLATASNTGQSDPGNFTLQEIDDRIRQLKHELHSKKRKLDEEMSLVN